MCTYGEWGHLHGVKRQLELVNVVCFQQGLVPMTLVYPFPESSFSRVMKDDPPKIIRLTAPTIYLLFATYLAMIFLQGKKMS